MDQVHANLYLDPAPDQINSPPYTPAELQKLKSLTRKRWIADNSKDAATVIRRVNKTLNFLRSNPYDPDKAFADEALDPHLESWDFSDMYNNTDTADIVKMHQNMTDNIKALLATAKGTHTSIHVRVDNKTASYVAEWSLPLEKLSVAKQKEIKKLDETVFTLDEYQKLYEGTMTTAYSKFNGILRHQITGIPQGIECGVYCANSLCAYYEFLFTQQCIKHHDLKTLEQLQYCLRYIDDIITPLTRDFNKFKYQADPYMVQEGPHKGTFLPGIYPPGLTLKLEGATHTHSPGDEIPKHSLTFLDHLYRIENGYVSIVQFDKRMLSKFDCTPMSRFTPQSSLLWDQAKVGSIQSELDRHFYASSTLNSFVSTAASTTLELYYRAYNWSDITRHLTKFIRSRTLIFPPATPAPSHSIYNAIMDRVNLLSCQGGLDLFNKRNARLGFPNPEHMPTTPPPVHHKKPRHFRASFSCGRASLHRTSNKGPNQ